MSHTGSDRPFGVCREQFNYTTSVKDHYQRVNVSTVDAGAFLTSLAKWSGFVGVKIDVEGFEYRLLPHLLLTVPRVCISSSNLPIASAGTRTHLLHLRMMNNMSPCASACSTLIAVSPHLVRFTLHSPCR